MSRLRIFQYRQKSDWQNEHTAQKHQPGHFGSSLELLNRPYHLETKQLKLAPEHFPFPASLRSLVLDLYAPTTQVKADQAMETDEVVGYLENIDTYQLGPLAAILTQTEAIGDPALPGSEQTAILEWVGASYAYWEKRFPVEEPLASEFRKLLPLTAALALTESDFLIPGAHSFHRLLDTMQASVVGWQSRLGRAGQNLERELGIAIAKARKWFDEGSVDLDTVYKEVLTATKKDRGRAKRMAQRVVEAEQGRLKTVRAHTQSAEMINALLSRYPVTASIEEFLKGPWHDSAQLLLLRFGLESPEWSSMSATTETLLDSIQIQADGTTDDDEKKGESRRQEVFESISKLPRQIKRWLLSLQHDDDAVDDAMSIIQFAHMSILRQQQLRMKTIEPILIARPLPEIDDPRVRERIQHLEIGQWFLFVKENGDPLRAQLVLKIEPDQQLIFTNQAGIKATHKSYTEFAASLKARKSIPLYSDHSFSRSLAHAVKISSQSDIKSLAGPAAEHAVQEHKVAIQKQREQEQDSQAKARQEQAEEEQLRKEFEEAVQAKREREEAEITELGVVGKEEVAVKPKEDEEPQVELAETAQEQIEYQAPEKERKPDRNTQQKKETTKHSSAEIALQQGQEEEQHALEETFLSTPNKEQAKATPQPTKAGEARLPMGAWLGFHDGDKPLLAKLAAHDKEEDNYIFVNRKGIKMRDLSRRELDALMDNGLVEVLKAQSSFKDEDTRARNKHKK